MPKRPRQTLGEVEPDFAEKHLGTRSKDEGIVVRQQAPNVLNSEAELRLQNVNNPLRSYQDSLEFLYSTINYEKGSKPKYGPSNFRLDRMRQLLKALDNPQDDFDIVHIAGTKGKGTVAHLIAAGLVESGCRTGLYTSPHLRSLRERIRVNGEMISKQQFVHIVDQVRSAALAMEESGCGAATFFELTTAMAVLHFSIVGAEVAVLEVGLGGRLDSTNVCDPILAIITSISLDHQKQLGNTLAQIAAEKAGIIKPGVPVLAAPGDAVAADVIKRFAAERAAPIHLFEPSECIEWEPMILAEHAPRLPCLPQSNHVGSLEKSSFAVSGKLEGLSQIHVDSSHADSTEIVQALGDASWKTPMLGRHQANNVGIALRALALLLRLGQPVAPHAVRTAIASTNPWARMQVVSARPTRIIDSAHNPASIAAGLNALSDHFADAPIRTLFASSHDKDWTAMLRLLLARSQYVVLTRFLSNPRAISIEKMAAVSETLIREEGFKCQVTCAEAPADAWQSIIREQAMGEVLYACGSFFLAAELLDHVLEPID